MDSTKLDRLARTAAWRYVGNRWWIDVDDLIQEAWKAGLEALPKIDPARGPDAAGAYVWRAMIMCVRKLVIRSSAPVSCRDNGTEMKNLIGIMQADLDEIMEEADPAPWAEAFLANEEWRCKVRLRLDEMATEGDANLDDMLSDESLRERFAELTS